MATRGKARAIFCLVRDRPAPRAGGGRWGGSWLGGKTSQTEQTSENKGEQEIELNLTSAKSGTQHGGQPETKRA